MAGLRQSRPGPPSGSQRGHKDIRPIAGILGGVGGALAGGASGAGAGAAATSDSNYDPQVTASTDIDPENEPPEAGERRGPSSITPNAPNSVGANNSINVVGAPYHPGFWANLATMGRAGLETGLGQNQAFYQGQLQANQQKAELAKQGLVNSGMLDIAKQNGLNTTQAMELQSHLEDLKSRNLANNPSNVDYLNNTITPQDQSRALVQAKTGTVNAGNQMQLANLINGIQSNPDFAQSLSLGTRASAAMPFTEAASHGIRLSPYESDYVNPTGTNPSVYTGVTPMGNTTSKGFNAKTLQQTETSTPNAPIPSSVRQLGPNGLPQIPIVNPSSVASPNGGGPISSFGASTNNPLVGMQTPSNSPAITPSAPKASNNSGLMTGNSIGGDFLRSLWPQGQSAFVPNSSVQPLSTNQIDPNSFMQGLQQYLQSIQSQNNSTQ